MNPPQPLSQKESKSNKLEEFRHALHALSTTEKMIFSVFVAIFICTTLYLVWQLNLGLSVRVPVSGGTLTEGIVGYPRFVNPVLVVTDSDRDLTELLYAGLMRTTTDGSLQPDLAESYTISPDGLTYTFTLRDNIYFHDSVPITTEDVEFTIMKAQDPAIKSPKSANWSGVTIQKIDSRHISFILKKPYAPFIENTTIGILPKHIWKDVDPEQFAYSQFNTNPIGSGPYKFLKMKFTTSGVPEYYDLVPFNRYPLGTPFIEHLIVRVYPNEKNMIDAYKHGDIESMYDITPQEVASLKKDTEVVETSPLPRVFGVFFNQSQAPVLANKEVRQALAMSVDKNRIIKEVLSGYGVAINDPIPPSAMTVSSSTPVSIYSAGSATASSSAQLARALLIKNGWQPNTEGIFEKKVGKDTVTLKFSISTSDVPELMQSAYLVADMWKEIGVDVSVKIFETSELNQTVIRPRNFDTLLFGEIIGRDMDLYAFWHSSQRNDPGLNIAGYVNLKADKILENARTIDDLDQREAQYALFENEIRNDIPAVFLYSPEFIYIIPKKLQGFALGAVTTPAERFDSVQKWFIETDTIWRVFADQKSIINDNNNE